MAREAADEYVDGAWDQNATPAEVETGVSSNISLHSFPPAYRLGQQSPTLYQQQERGYGTPYRGGVTTAHGVGQLVDVEPPDAPLEDIPSAEGPVIGGNPAETPMSFPEPVPVQVVSMPQTNQIPGNRDGQVRLPPRDGEFGVPQVQNVLSREQNRDSVAFAAGNHTDPPGVPYCVHFTFQRDLGNFIYNPNRPQATWGVPIKSDGSWFHDVKHTEGIYGFNTMHFDAAWYERYLTWPHLVNKAMWLIDGMDAENYLANEVHYGMPDRALQTMRMVKSDVSKMDFLAMAEEDMWRTLHFSVTYSSQVG